MTRLALKGLGKDCLEIRAYRGIVPCGRNDLLLRDPSQHVICCPRGVVGELAGQQVVQDDAQAVDIGSRRQLRNATGGLFGRHVARCPRDLPVEGYRSGFFISGEQQNGA